MTAFQPDVALTLPPRWAARDTGCTALQWQAPDGGVLTISSPAFLGELPRNADLAQSAKTIAERTGLGSVVRVVRGENMYGAYARVECSGDQVVDLCAWLFEHDAHDPLWILWADDYARESGRVAREMIEVLRPGSFLRSLDMVLSHALSVARSGSEYIEDHITLVAARTGSITTVSMAPFFGAPAHVLADIVRHERARAGADVVIRARTLLLDAPSGGRMQLFELYAESPTRKKRLIVDPKTLVVRTLPASHESVHDFFLPASPQFASAIDGLRVQP